MRSRIVKVLSVLMLGLVIVLVSGRQVVAEPRDHDSKLVGTWRVQVALVDCQTGTALSAPAFSSLLTFAHGGTMAEDTTNPSFGPGQRGAGQGVWDHKPGGTYAARSVAFINYTTQANPAAHNPGFEAGEQTITQTITFEDGPDKWSSTADIEFSDTTGAVYRQACAVASAQRF
ncbi:MAG TPA: hypothetical protein VN517_02005 [Terriglobales bacterium]|jgi:hypothetical protein|nr:hypothetical protein [Terriglobales bacterium]